MTPTRPPATPTAQRPLPRDAARLARTLSRACAAASLEVFARLYFPGRFTLPYDWGHRDALRALEAFLAGPRSRMVLTLPPRHGKSTLFALALPLWRLAHHRAASVTVVRPSRDSAREWVDELASEISRADLFLRRFPGLTPTQHRRDRIRFRSGASLQVVALYESLTAGAQHALAHPPSLVVVDDPEPSRLNQPVGTGWLNFDQPIPWVDPAPLIHWLEASARGRLGPGGKLLATGAIRGHDAALAVLADHREGRDWDRYSAGFTIPGNPRAVRFWGRWGRVRARRGPEQARRFYLRFPERAHHDPPDSAPAPAPAFADVERCLSGYLDCRGDEQQISLHAAEWLASCRPLGAIREWHGWEAADEAPPLLTPERLPRLDDDAHTYEWGWAPGLLDPDWTPSRPSYTGQRTCRKTGKVQRLDLFRYERMMSGRFEVVMQARQKLLEQAQQQQHGRASGQAPAPAPSGAAQNCGPAATAPARSPPPGAD